MSADAQRRFYIVALLSAWCSEAVCMLDKRPPLYAGMPPILLPERLTALELSEASGRRSQIIVMAAHSVRSDLRSPFRGGSTQYDQPVEILLPLSTSGGSFGAGTEPMLRGLPAAWRSLSVARLPQGGRSSGRRCRS
jgi:hypothetical protein